MRLLPLLIAAVVFVGCGGSDPAPSSAGGDPAQSFAGTCGNCHTLAAADTDGTYGPNLDELAPDEAQVLAAIEEGPGGMPGGLLEGAAAEEVAAYVADNAGG